MSVLDSNRNTTVYFTCSDFFEKPLVSGLFKTIQTHISRGGRDRTLGWFFGSTLTFLQVIQ